jgi:nitric oxide reductase subunit C
LFVLLVGNSFMQARVIEQTNPISADAGHGKRFWERNACFDCHTSFGEDARFARVLPSARARNFGKPL